MRSVALALLYLVVFLQAQNPPDTVYAYRITTQPTIDGILNDAAWDQSKSISGMIQRNPDEGRPATQKSLIWVAYDDAYLYVAARLFDTHPDSIIARPGRRDADTQSDRFGIFLDTYRDLRSGYFFELNAAGVYCDGVINNDTYFDDDWDAVWEGKARVDDKGWSVEMRIPLSQMRFPNKEIQHWGVNFGREIKRRKEETYYVSWPRNENNFVSRFAPLEGITHIRPAKNLELLPYVRVKNRRAPAAPGDPFNSGSEYKAAAGLDIKYGVTSNLTLNATVNPDFGQVEVDPAVVNLSDFETFYSEKRPFFIEGASNYSFGNGGATSNWNFNWSNPNFFYSRRIGRRPQGSAQYLEPFSDTRDGSRIIGAAKITGKVGNNINVGALSALTAREYSRLSADGASVYSKEVEPLTTYNVLRLIQERNEGRNGIGMIATGIHRFFRDPALKKEMNANALSLGTDGWHFIDNEKVWVLSGWLGYSRIKGSPEQILRVQTGSTHRFQRPDFNYISVDSQRTILSGFAGRLALSKEKGNWLFNSAFGFIQPEFDVNDMGFLFRTNVINAHVAGGYRWTNPSSWYRNLSVLTSVFGNMDFDGNINNKGLWSMLNWQGLNYLNAGSGLFYSLGGVNTDMTRGGPVIRTPASFSQFWYFNTDRTRNISMSAGGNYFTSVEGSYGFGANLGITYHPWDNLKFSISPSYNVNVQDAQWVGAFEDHTATETYATRYVFGALHQKTFSTEFRLDWTFSPELSLQIYARPFVSSAQYTDFKYLTRPDSYDFTSFSEGGSIRSEENRYYADADGPDGPAQEISFANPDFSFTDLRGNAVLRWEYSAGSRLYFVWTQSRSFFQNRSTFQPGSQWKDLLLNEPTDNIFLIKISYWLGY